ncbi:hypothetical protein [Saccharopolyspora sp. CA-218241]|uniref:hypothetical protein n=1 Tax=Saccharopolyspora sp. CA-218241 TaxID=3240027 RepID=UPI003D99FC52
MDGFSAGRVLVVFGAALLLALVAAIVLVVIRKGATSGARPDRSPGGGPVRQQEAAVGERGSAVTAGGPGFPDNVLPFEGERIIARYWANRRQEVVNFGGTLYLSSHRILFLPNRINANLGGKKWWCPRADVAGAGVVCRNGVDLFSGGLVRRLKVETGTGPAPLFVVPEPNLVAQDIRTWASSRDGGADRHAGSKGDDQPRPRDAELRRSSRRTVGGKPHVADSPASAWMSGCSAELAEVSDLVPAEVPSSGGCGVAPGGGGCAPSVGAGPVSAPPGRRPSRSAGSREKGVGRRVRSGTSALGDVLGRSAAP